MTKEEKKISTRDTVIGGIIFLVIVLGIAFGLVWWMDTNNQKFIDRGCTASGSSDWLGNPTYWSCPDPKETQKFIDRGCTPILSDEIRTTWSCPK